jgi:hypothetical protein
VTDGVLEDEAHEQAIIAAPINDKRINTLWHFFISCLRIILSYLWTQKYTLFRHTRVIVNISLQSVPNSSPALPISQKYPRIQLFSFFNWQTWCLEKRVFDKRFILFIMNKLHCYIVNNYWENFNNF